MKKKIIFLVIIILVVLLAGFYYWNSRQNSLQYQEELTGQEDVLAVEKSSLSVGFNIYTNTNEKFGYSINYPENWFIGSYGEATENAQAVFLVSDESDLSLGDSGLLAGSKVEIIAQNLDDFKNLDESFSGIDSIDKYIWWQKDNQVGVSTLLQGECVEEKIQIGGIDAIKQICENPTDENVPKIKVLQILSPDLKFVYFIQYSGMEPHYSDNTEIFDKMYKTFILNYLNN